MDVDDEKFLTDIIINYYKDPKTGLKNSASIYKELKKNDEVQKRNITFTKNFVNEVLNDFYPHAVNRKLIQKFTRRKTYTSKVWKSGQIDLAELSKAQLKENKPIRYLLIYIDIFSRFAFVEPLENKKENTVVEAMKEILDTVPKDQVKYIQSDRGTEFYNKTFKSLMKSRKITHYSSFSYAKAAIAERFIRTLKGRLGKLEDVKALNDEEKPTRFIDELDKVVENYNNTEHRSIKMTPKEATLEKNNKTVHKRLFGVEEVVENLKKFEVGDLVRIGIVKNAFQKESGVNNFSSEVFKIKNINGTTPQTYEIEDMSGRAIDGSYYPQELVPVSEESLDSMYVIEKIKKRKKVDGKEFAFVSYLNLPAHFDEWLEIVD